MHLRRRMYSKATLAGHPIHPMLVGFPVAFYSASTAAYVVYAITGDVFAFKLGVVSNIAGVMGAFLAAVPGAIDWIFGIPSGHPAKTVGLEHMLLNVGALILFCVDGSIQCARWNESHPAWIVAVALAGCGLGLTAAAGFLGWTMVQRHHVGVKMTPEQQKFDMARHAQPARLSQIRHS